MVMIFFLKTFLILNALMEHSPSIYVWLQLLLPDARLISVRFAFHSEYPVAARINCWSLLPARLITGILLKHNPLQNMNIKQTI